jgi:hypothetical protein
MSGSGGHVTRLLVMNVKLKGQRLQNQMYVQTIQRRILNRKMDIKSVSGE